MGNQTKNNQQPQDNGYNAFVHNMKLMNQIVAAMKEVPMLPSEQPKDVAALVKVEFPDEGGMLTYMEGHEHPYKGFPYFEFVEKFDMIKKLTRAFLSKMYHSLKSRNKLSVLALLPSIWLFKDLFVSSVYSFYRVVDRFKVKKVRYSTVVRNLHTAFSVEIAGESAKDKELREMMRDIVCMGFEFDNAYRFRFQDVIAELDKEQLNKNPIKELKRLIILMQSREKTQEIKDTWELIKYGVVYYIRFDKKLLNTVKNVLNNLIIEECKLSVEDQHYCKPRKDYTFGFMSK